ncbi:MAG: hypothetical protein Q9190_007892, partial [Brigantiaea leucoxantha]
MKIVSSLFIFSVLLPSTLTNAVPDVNTAASGQKNTATIQYLASYNSILQIINTYPHGIDLKNFDISANLYAADGCFQVPILNISACGIPAIRKSIVDSVNPPGREPILTQHTINSITIDIDEDGNNAKAMAYLA